MQLFQFFSLCFVKGWTHILHPRENVIGKFHSLALPDQVIHIFTYYSPAQSTSGKCNIMQFFSCLQKCTALIPGHVWRYKLWTSKFQNNTCYSVSIFLSTQWQKRGQFSIPYHFLKKLFALSKKIIFPFLNSESGQVPWLTAYSNQQCIMILSMALTATIVGLCERVAVITHEKLFKFIATYK
jgi:hypothetical protein